MTFRFTRSAAGAAAVLLALAVPASARAFIVALAVTSIVACYAPPDRDSASDEQSTAADVVDHCTRGIQTAGILRGLTAYRFEQTPDRTEIESAILPNGVSLTIVYSGCDHSNFEYRFTLESTPDKAIPAQVLELAAQLMRSVAEASSSGNANSLASRIAKAASEGDYGLGEDITGGFFEEYESISVSLESVPGFPDVLVINHHFIL